MAEPASNIVPGPTPYRTAPHNIEAEQALLGAILVNNDAFYRVSDFLKPEHFYEPLHRKIYEVAAEMIRSAKRQSGDIKTFLPADEKIGDMTVPIPCSRGRGSDDHHQCRRLWPFDLRSGDAPLADHHRRGHGQYRL